MAKKKAVKTAEKTCTQCNATHPATLDYFPPNKRGVLGLSSWCRECHRVKGREDQRRRRSAQVVGLARDEKVLPNGRVESTKVVDGLRQVRFGLEWKPTRDALSPDGMRGYASPLTRSA